MIREESHDQRGRRHVDLVMEKATSWICKRENQVESKADLDSQCKVNPNLGLKPVRQ